MSSRFGSATISYTHNITRWNYTPPQQVVFRSDINNSQISKIKITFRAWFEFAGFSSHDIIIPNKDSKLADIYMR